MTKIRSGNSSMIDDRRAGGGGGGGGLGGMLGGGGIPLPGKLGGGLVGILLALAVLILPRVLNGTGNGTNSASQTGSQAADLADGTCNSDLESIICGATEDVQNFWNREFQSEGRTYEYTKTVFFAGSTDTGCGAASAETGPFYCPNDHLVYMDLDFLVQLENQFGIKGDLASQYIVAHEYGHHIQNLLGTNAAVQEASQNDPSSANAQSVALELQADCYAGVWANDANSRGLLDNSAEINEALDAAADV
ncbi:MAG: hypothetical protein JWL72_3183, partial [Ilumatobacteraceae bacterium]|nr:hypothetical protein [Ilumatobacteraceae bacterium]